MSGVKNLRTLAVKSLPQDPHAGGRTTFCYAGDMQAEPVHADAGHQQKEQDVYEPSSEAKAQAQELRFNPRYFTAAELAQHDGVAPDAMLLLAIRSSGSETAAVLDVSAGGSDFYGPGRTYHVFVGADCSRAFSLSSLAPEHRHGRMDGATQEEWQVLDDWHDKLVAKYPTVGLLEPMHSPSEGAYENLRSV